MKSFALTTVRAGPTYAMTNGAITSASALPNVRCAAIDTAV